MNELRARVISQEKGIYKIQSWPRFLANTDMRRKRFLIIPRSGIMSLPCGRRTTAMRSLRVCFRERAALSEKRLAQESRNRLLPPTLIPPLSVCR